MLWTKDDLPPDVAKERAALEAAAAAWEHRMEGGRRLKFTAQEVPRLAFLAWRIETGRLDPHEGGSVGTGD